MRLATFRQRNLVLSVTAAILVVAWILGPAISVPFPSWVFIVGAIAVLVVNVGLNFRAFRAIRSDAARIAAAHPGSVAFPTGISSWPHLEKAERDSIIVLVADDRGLSFRDHNDREVQLIPADHILSLELAPLDPRARFRPFRVLTIDGGTIDFIGPAKPDDQVDAVVALRTALGRAAG